MISESTDGNSRAELVQEDQSLVGISSEENAVSGPRHKNTFE
jgi:hypothetical protein